MICPVQIRFILFVSNVKNLHVPTENRVVNLPLWYSVIRYSQRKVMFKPSLLKYSLAFVVFGSACSDYNLFNDDEPKDVDTAPLLQVFPSVLDAGIICETNPHVETVVLANEGNDILEIEALEVTGDWTLISNPSPFVIEAGQQFPLQLETGTEDATLVVASTDYDWPVMQVPLTGTLDRAPTLQVITPYSGLVISEDTVFEGVVTDDVDLPEDLVVSWNSTVDGVFATSQVEPDGTVFGSWNMQHTSGYHTIEASVQDSCNNSVIQRIDICQQMRYEIDSLDISTWHFEGSANWDTTNDWLELTPVASAVVGTAFSTSQEVSGGHVEIDFLFYIGDGTGADGISLTALDVDRMTTFLGGTGCGIGYGGDASCTTGPALPGWSIEIDTYYNDGQDPTPSDHVMFTFDGDVDDPEVWAELPEMEDTGWHQMRVLVQEPRVQVEIDGVTYIDQDIPGFFNFDAYVGFTAGTGGQTNQHLIDALVVTNQICGD